MKLGNVEQYLHMMRRIGLPILLTLLLLAKRGVTALRNPPEELWVSSSVLMVCCCIFFGLWATAASAVHYGKETHEMVRPPIPLPVFGLAACTILMTAIATYEGQQLHALLKQGGHVADWWRPEQLG